MYRTTLDLHRAKVHKIMEFMPFNKGEMKFFSFTSSDRALNMPSLDKVLASTDIDEIRDSLAAPVQEIANQIWESALITNVRKHHTFNFGDTGRLLLNVMTETPPNQVDWILMLVEIDQDVRGVGRAASAIVQKDNLEEIARGIALLAGTPFGTTSTAAFGIAVFLMKAIGNVMQQNSNDQVGYIEQSFLLDDDFGVGPDAARDAQQIQDLKGNMWYDYTLKCMKLG